MNRYIEKIKTDIENEGIVIEKIKTDIENEGIVAVLFCYLIMIIFVGGVILFFIDITKDFIDVAKENKYIDKNISRQEVLVMLDSVGIKLKSPNTAPPIRTNLWPIYKKIDKSKNSLSTRKIYKKSKSLQEAMLKWKYVTHTYDGKGFFTETKNKSSMFEVCFDFPDSLIKKQPFRRDTVKYWIVTMHTNTTTDEMSVYSLDLYTDYGGLIETIYADEDEDEFKPLLTDIKSEVNALLAEHHYIPQDMSKEYDKIPYKVKIGLLIIVSGVSLLPFVFAWIVKRIENL